MFYKRNNCPEFHFFGDASNYDAVATRQSTTGIVAYFGKYLVY